MDMRENYRAGLAGLRGAGLALIGAAALYSAGCATARRLGEGLESVRDDFMENVVGVSCEDLRPRSLYQSYRERQRRREIVDTMLRDYHRSMNEDSSSGSGAASAP